MKIAVLFTAFGCFELCIRGAAEFTFENSPLSSLEFVHQVRNRLLICRVFDGNAVNY